MLLPKYDCSYDYYDFYGCTTKPTRASIIAPAMVTCIRNVAPVTVTTRIPVIATIISTTLRPLIRL